MWSRTRRSNVSHMWRHRLRTANPLLWGHHSCHRHLLHWHTLHRHTLLNLDHTSLLYYHALSQTLLLLLLLKLLHPNLLLLLLLLQDHPLLNSLWHWLTRLARHLLSPLEASHYSRPDLGSSWVDGPLHMHHARLNHASLPSWLLLCWHSGSHHWLTIWTNGTDHTWPWSRSRSRPHSRWWTTQSRHLLSLTRRMSSSL